MSMNKPEFWKYNNTCVYIYIHIIYMYVYDTDYDYEILCGIIYIDTNISIVVNSVTLFTITHIYYVLHIYTT